MTAQGHPRVIFQRVLDLTALIAFKQPERFSRVSGRWLLRYLEAVEDATIYDASFMTACLQALGGRHHGHALAALRGMAEETTTRSRGRGVA